MTDWQNRIVSHGVKPAGEFRLNRSNPRKHPPAQHSAVRGSLDTLGWIAPVIELASGELLDGEDRILNSLEKGDDTPVPYIVIDLTEDEARLALLTFDFITAMASYDRDLTASLMEQVNTDNAALQSLIAGMAEEQGIIPDLDPGNATHGSNGNYSAGESSNGDDGDYTPPESTVRMVQLFLNTQTFDEFFALIASLRKTFPGETITDVVLEVLRHANTDG
jgi:hypothetical protein